MSHIKIIASAALLVAGASIGFAKTGASLQDQQQAACYGDVSKFCKDEMPDIDKVKACMSTKKAKVSAKCAAMWDVK